MPADWINPLGPEPAPSDLFECGPRSLRAALSPSVGAAGACGAPWPLRAVGGARGRWRGGRCTEGWVWGRGRRRSIWTASCF